MENLFEQMIPKVKNEFKELGKQFPNLYQSILDELEHNYFPSDLSVRVAHNLVDLIKDNKKSSSFILNLYYIFGK